MPPIPTPDVSPILGGEKEIRPPAEYKETTNTQDGGDHRCPKCEATFSHPLVLSLHQMSEHSGKSVKLSILITGLVTHSILFFSRISAKRFVFCKRTIKACVSCFLTASWDLCVKRDLPDSVLVVLKFRRQCMRRGWRPLKGPVSAQKALSRV